MDLILFGIQGSGKGTQGKILKERYGAAYFETGSELRRLSKEDSDLGRKVKETIEAGHLVSDEIVMEIVEDFLSHVEEGENIIFDGIPRKLEQSESLKALLSKHEREYKVLILDLSQDEAMKRLTQRRVCEGCKEVYPASYDKEACEKCGGKLITRTDDNADSIKVRLQTFFDETMPVIDNYEQEGKLIRINGEQSIEDVSFALFNALDPLYK